jgi:hypothetical protein
MNTFFYIIKKNLNIPSDIFGNWDNKDPNRLTQHILFSSFIFKNINSIEEKYVVLRDILNNPFITCQQKNEFLNIFCLVQKTYFALSRVAYLYQYKKSKLVVDFDMCLNPIDINNKNSICLFQEKNRYYFRINDLINIIDTALCNSPMFFSNPLISKNPYNNVPFNKSTLYNIYFNIITKTFIIPELIHKFFLTNFDLNQFEKDYEYLIRETAIVKYVNNSTADVLHNSILQMIQDFNYTNFLNRITIDKSFPKKILITVMKPYLMLYYTYKYSLDTIKKIVSQRQFIKKMKEFNIFNPFFGTKQIKITKTSSYIYTNTYIYNEKHIIFNNNKNNTNTFLKSHLKINNIIHSDSESDTESDD